MALNISTKVGD